MKLGLGSQGGVVDVADVMLRAHVRNEALTRVATTLAQDFQDLFTPPPITPYLKERVCNIGLVGQTGAKEGKNPPGKRFLDFRNSSK